MARATSAPMSHRVWADQIPEPAFPTFGDDDAPRADVMCEVLPASG